MAVTNNKDTYKQEFISLLESIDNSKSKRDNFNNFCVMAYSALAKQTAPSPQRAEELEAQYMAIVRTYSNKDDVRKIPNLMSYTILALNLGGCDFLGEIASELEILDKKNGQFFTPYHISKMMAKISLPDPHCIIEKDGFFSLSDPAAGAGCMILAAADSVDEQGFSASDCMSVQAIELNRMTFHMLYIQLALRGIAAEVIHGNTLTMEIFETAYTPAAIYFLGKHGKLFKESDNTAPVKRADIQLNLFDWPS